MKWSRLGGTGPVTRRRYQKVLFETIKEHGYLENQRLFEFFFIKMVKLLCYADPNLIELFEDIVE
jgi:hypothetical protein